MAPSMPDETPEYQLGSSPQHQTEWHSTPNAKGTSLKTSTYAANKLHLYTHKLQSKNMHFMISLTKHSMHTTQ